MRFEDVCKVHLRSLEMLLSVRLRNAFKLLTPECFENVQRAYLRFKKLPSPERLYFNFKS